MTFINPQLGSTTTEWWKDSVSDFESENIMKRLSLVIETSFVRRKKDDVLKELVPKHVKSGLVQSYLSEQSVYESYEERVHKALQDFGQLAHQHDSGNPIVQAKLKELFTILMALMSNMVSESISLLVLGSDLIHSLSALPLHTALGKHPFNLSQRTRIHEAVLTFSPPLAWHGRTPKSVCVL
jgi:hypothetical protein